MDLLSSNPLRLPTDVQLEYLAEGGANIVYRMRTSTGSHMCQGNVLRLHKKVSWIPSYTRLHQAQERLIRPLFEHSQLLPQSLVLLPAEMLSMCNASLRKAEQATAHETDLDFGPMRFQRPANRHGTYLAEDEPFGLLLKDMTANVLSGELGLELKPKWLLQSPNAPIGSIRCRTCALRAMRAHEHDNCGKSRKMVLSSSGYFCPLELTSNQRADAAKVVDAILGDLRLRTKLDLSVLKIRLIDYFVNNPLLARLRELQSSLDQHGILELPNGPILNEQFLIATTLRDCTLFLKVSKNFVVVKKETDEKIEDEESMGIEARLGDLDLKVPNDLKIRYWRETEKQLIKEGWYLGCEQTSGEVCRLARVQKATSNQPRTDAANGEDWSVS